MKNELSFESSPYLLQHAHNPVHWQPWNEHTLQLAQKLNKPILVSIGYSACHWCHVMEKESFENEATAALMNDYFVNIKVDREERPDIDHIYMDAVQAMIGNGGWPLNVFLTPDAKPFFGGTYFPPTKAHGRSSWTDVITNIHHTWTTQPEAMLTQANNVVEHLKKSNNFSTLNTKINVELGEMLFTKEHIQQITENLLATADTEKGGFGNAPKFPQTFSINCLLQCAYFLKDKAALAHAELSINKMLNGGIYDQIGGGLCRYSTDEDWLAPHYEKMLYDNALFVTTLCQAYQLTQNESYKNAVEHICQFLFEEMKHPQGGYYAAIDADSEGEEGKFYVWEKAEIEKLLGNDAAFFCKYYNVTENGNWEHKNILQITQPLEKLALQWGKTFSSAAAIISKCQNILLAERNKRIRPNTDDKILLSWNALLITAFCNAYAITLHEKYKTEAEALFLFIENNFAKNNGSYNHTFKNGEAKYPAFLDDYAYYTQACINLQEITGDEKYLHKAKNIVDYLYEHFYNEENGFYFFTQNNQQDIIVRKIEIYDGATPSGNSIMAKNLEYLSIVFDNKAWQQRSVNMIESLKTIILKHPNSFAIWASIAINKATGINEISIIGNNMMPQLQKMLLLYIPNKILISSNKVSTLPILAEKKVLENTMLYLCRNNVCLSPFNSYTNLFSYLENNLFNIFLLQ